MKDMVIMSGTLDRSRYKGRARMSTLNKGSSLFGGSIKLPPPSQRKISPAERFKKHIKPSRKSEARPNKPTKKSSIVNPPLLESSLVTASLPVSVLRQPPRDNNGTPDSDQASSLSFSSDEEFTYEFSDEDDDGYEAIAVDQYENLAPGAPRYYTAITSYDPGSDDSGVHLSPDQEVEVIGINPYGWWWIRATNYAYGEVEEGWVPASYLQVSKFQSIPEGQ